MIVHSLCPAIIFDASYAVVLGFTYKWNNRHDWKNGSRITVRRCQPTSPPPTEGSSPLLAGTPALGIQLAADIASRTLHRLGTSGVTHVSETSSTPRGNGSWLLLQQPASRSWRREHHSALGALDSTAGAPGAPLRDPIPQAGADTEEARRAP